MDAWMRWCSSNTWACRTSNTYTNECIARRAMPATDARAEARWRP